MLMHDTDREMRDRRASFKSANRGYNGIRLSANLLMYIAFFFGLLIVIFPELSEGAGTGGTRKSRIFDLFMLIVWQFPVGVTLLIGSLLYRFTFYKPPEF
jgi:hypothetical protein